MIDCVTLWAEGKGQISPGWNDMDFRQLPKMNVSLQRTQFFFHYQEPSSV